MWWRPTIWLGQSVGWQWDIDYLYKDYMQIIPGNTWRTIVGTVTIIRTM